MSMSYVNDNDITLIQTINAVIQGKWVILLFFVFSLVGTYVYQELQPEEDFYAVSEITPISSRSTNDYSLLNSYINLITSNLNVNNNDGTSSDYFNDLIKIIKNDIKKLKISKDAFYNKFIEELQFKKVIEDAFKEYEILDRDDFQDLLSYNDAISGRAQSVKIVNNPKNETHPMGFWTLEFQFNNKEKWLDILKYLNKEVNENVRKDYVNFIDLQIENYQNLKLFRIEDVKDRIKIANFKYDTITGNRLAYLKEQARIARKLDIKFNAIRSIQSETKQIILANDKYSFYLNGYLAIEEEIDLIEERENKEPFIDNLVLYKQEIMDLLNEKVMMRIENIIKETPVYKKTDFMSGNILIKGTMFKTNNINLYIIIGLLGIITGIFYVIINSFIRNINFHKET
jgi:hypothetical protein